MSLYRPPDGQDVVYQSRIVILKDNIGEHAHFIKAYAQPELDRYHLICVNIVLESTS